MNLTRTPESLADAWEKWTRHRHPFTELRFEGAPGDYAPWKASALVLLGGYEIGKSKPTRLDLAAMSVAAAEWSEHDCPIYWMDRGFLNAISESFPPEDIPLASLRWPFPTMALQFPKGTFVGPFGDCSALIISRISGKTPLISVWAVCYSDLTKCIFRAQQETGLFIKAEVGSSTLPLEQRSFSVMCWDVAMRLMLAITARPELIESSPTEPKGKKSKAKRRFRTPRWIGRGYQPKTSGPTENHPGVRLHWRKGHFRNQAFGKGLSQSKVIWLEPCLVGGKRGGEA